MWNSLIFISLFSGCCSLFSAGLPQTFPYHYDWSENETSDDDGASNHLEPHPERIDNTNTVGPYFDYEFFRNETVMVGHTAYLKCMVKNIGNKTVSWVRHRDINLLTVGLNSYTSDNRFLSIHEHDAEEWTLKVSTIAMIAQLQFKNFFSTKLLWSQTSFIAPTNCSFANSAIMSLLKFVSLLSLAAEILAA